MKMIGIILFLMMIVLILPFDKIYATSVDPILITISPSMNDLVFDGRWTNYPEWKNSSWNQLSYDDGMIIHLRTAHYEDFIFVFVDPVKDHTLDKGLDKATVCLDGQNNKAKVPGKDDFCFSVSLGHKQGVVFQGGSPIALKGNFKKISNPVGFIAVSSVSDENDRYSTTPHPSYEFRIPIELIERSSSYGFYLSVYDADSKTFYTWPKESHRESLFRVPSPSEWGDIVSPDKSIPEFEWPSLALLPALLIMIFLTKHLDNAGTKKTQSKNSQM